MLNITQIVYEKPLSTTNKKEYTPIKKSKMKVAKKLTKYLNQAQELTDDYFIALRLTDLQPDEILEIKNKELRSLASLIYMCCDMLRFLPHEICYSNRKFKVNIIKNQI